MNVDYVFFVVRSGRIVQAGSCEALYLDLHRQMTPPGCDMLLATAPNVEDFIVRDGAVVPLVHERSLDAARAEADTAVRADAEAQRRRFISPGIGKAMAYQQKAAEAEAFLRAETPTSDAFPHIFGEASAMGLEPIAMATLIIALRDRWQRASAEIERIERTAILAVQSAETLAHIDAAEAIDWSMLDALDVAPAGAIPSEEQ